MQSTLVVFLGGGKTMNPCFPTIAFMTHNFFGIVGSQIEIEKIFALVKILTNLRRCMLQTYILDKLIFLINN
jgi:hypothetical protein